MSVNIPLMLEFAQGPVFRLAFALMVLGLLRLLLLGISDALGAYLVTADRDDFWRKVRLRLLWFTFPSLLLRRLRPGGSPRLFAYHMCICCVSLLFRIGAIIVPVFMIGHVHLWERAFAVTWPALPSRTADVLSIIVIVLGLILFFARLYSPVLRKLEPPWTFLKPLLLVIPFITGMMSMRPSWSPIDYHLVLLVHTLSAAAVFILIPFGRMLSCIHTPLTEVMPEAAWRRPADADAADPEPIGTR